MDLNEENVIRGKAGVEEMGLKMHPTEGLFVLGREFQKLVNDDRKT